MRVWSAAILLGLCACGQQQRAKPPQEPPQVAFDGALAAEASAKVAHGERLTRVLGCRGCHGKDLQGERFYERYASNLTRDLANYSDGQLAALLREGVHPSGREVWAMPSEIFQHLSDADLTALTAFLRTLKPAGPPSQPPLPFEKETQALIAKGELKPAAEFVREEKALAPVDLGPRHALGRYITRVTCAECHGAELKGRGNPDLVVTGAYSRAEFARLITQGIPTGNRKLKEMMVGVAKDRFAHLTPNERDALYAYLKARAEQPR